MELLLLLLLLFLVSLLLVLYDLVPFALMVLAIYPQ
jgi:hypothetical protein